MSEKQDASQRESRKFKKKRDHRRFRSEPPNASALFGRVPRHSSGDGVQEEAESHLLRVLEERKARAKASHDDDDDWKPSVEGERPPLRRVSFQPGGSTVFSPAETEHSNDEDHRNKFRTLALKMHTLKSNRNLGLDTSERPEAIDETHEKDGTDVFEDVGGTEAQLGTSAFSQADTNTDAVISAAIAVDENYRKQDDDTASVMSDSVYSEVSDTDVGTDQELLPLAGNSRRMSHHRGMRSRWKRRKKKCYRFFRRMCRHDRYWFGEVLHPVSLFKATIRFLTRSWFVRLGLPCLIAAIVLFYYLGNPSLDFMGETTISWWLIFIARQTLTLQLAIVTQSVIIDAFALKSRFAVTMFSPLLTLCVISAKGWPFLAVSWALWDLTLLHGDDQFQQNWFYWTDIALFSPANAGGYILDKDIYLRTLLAVIIAGVATSIKRTVLALYFGKKTVLYYKVRMDKLLADMSILSDVGELASAADDLVDAASEGKESISAAVKTKVGKQMITSSHWKEIEHIESPSNSEGESQDDKPAESKLDKMEEDRDDEADEEDGSISSEEEGSGTEKNAGISWDTNSTTSDTEQSKVSRRYSRERSLSGSERRFKNLLERWKEPESKTDRASSASISDILDFRKKLTVMDTKYPFSAYFGAASTRDECILSSQKTYNRLLKLDPGTTVLSFDIIAMLAMEPDGSIDEKKRRLLRRFFRPDRFDELTILAFVQVCDSVYKQLRYFRASVGNSSVIDQVLEQIVDCIFYFVLALVLLSVLKLNPWALLVSLSTLLFSTAFAIGPSLSRYIEGVLMIIARRPYDLGDRVVICGAENPTNFLPQLSWFVEDLNLFSTTLRFANTNEVSTVNNASISTARIVNLNRSPNAVITLSLYFMDSATDDQLSVFSDTIDSFIGDRPRIWESMLFFRCECINQDLELMEYILQVRHTKSWQDTASVLMSKSELLKFCFATGKQLGINYDSPPRASWTINSFHPLNDDEIPGDMNAALAALDDQGGTSDRKDAAEALLRGKAKGMRSLERRKTKIGGQYAFSR